MIWAEANASTEPVEPTAKMALGSFQCKELSIQGTPTRFQHKDQAFQGSVRVYGPHLEVRS